MGFPVRHEPKNIDSLRRNIEVLILFEEVIWIKYFSEIKWLPRRHDTSIFYELGQNPFIY